MRLVSFGNCEADLASSLAARLSRLDRQLTKEDRATVDNMRRLGGLLRQQSDELQAFWQSGDKERGHNHRAICLRSHQNGDPKLKKIWNRGSCADLKPSDPGGHVVGVVPLGHGICSTKNGRLI